MTPAHDATPPPSPANVASPSSQENSSERPHRMRSIQELYDDTEEITNFDFLCCLFADSEPMIFDEAVTNKRLRQSHRGGDSVNREKQHLGVNNSS